jgi:integrase
MTDDPCLDRREIAALFRVIRSPRDRAIFRLLHFFPWGLTEITRLRMADWDDDLPFPRIRIPWARPFRESAFDLRPRHERPGYAKTVANAVRAWLRIRGRAHGPLFTSDFGVRGGRIKRKQITDLLQSYAEEAGLPSHKATLLNIRLLGDCERRNEAAWRLRNWH